MTAFWNSAPYSLVDVDPRFRGAYFLRHQGLMMEEVHASETPVYFNEAIERYIPEDYYVYAVRREGVKSRIAHLYC
jgi:hypothetical protein